MEEGKQASIVVHQVGEYTVVQEGNHYNTYRADNTGQTVLTVSYLPTSAAQLARAIKDANTSNAYHRPLNADKIRAAVDRGYQVYWIDEANRIIKDPITGEYVITSPNGTAMRLTSRRGPHDLNVHESDIYIHA